MTALQAILWSKGRMAAHNLASVRHESKLKIGVVSIAAILIWLGVLAGFVQGFLWLQNFDPSADPAAMSIGDILMNRLLSVFALALFFMLIFSNVLISYSTFYKAREVQYLIQAPVSIRTFFLARFIECVSFSSWASAFLGSPLIIAYGFTTGAPWGYYLVGLLVYVPFVTIPAAIGTCISMLIVRVFPSVPRVILFGVAIVTIGGLFVYLRNAFSATRLSDDTFLSMLLQTSAQTQSPLLPSYWASQGILLSAVGDYGEVLFLLLLIVANALFFTLIASEVAARIFMPGFSAIMGSEQNRLRPYGKGILGRLDGLLWFLPNPMRPLVAKDIRLFWRDPTQWTQFVIFFGIMTVYVANLGNGSFAIHSEAYRSWIAGLNSASCSLILASLTSRFVYPLISLEGFRFWILGLAPLTMRQLMRQKFWLSVAMTSPFTVGLVVMSCILLDVGPLRFGVAVYSIILANLTLAGLAVGLGSIYPNFEEDNPARIVSGMGGTLNFLLSVGYIAVLIGTQMVILQWEALAKYASVQTFWITMVGILVFNTVLSAAGTIIPMRLGLRNLLRVEF